MWLVSLLFLLLSSVVACAQQAPAARPIRSWSPVFTGRTMIQSGISLPYLLSNDTQTKINILSVTCRMEGVGTVTINPVLHGQGASSILKEPLVCDSTGWKSGALQDVPVLQSFGKDGATCPVEPCTADVNIKEIAGQPSYLVVKIVAQ